MSKSPPRQYRSRGDDPRSALGADAQPLYFLMREVVFGHDGSFSFDALVQRYNSDLANGYGNLVSRTLTMIGKCFDEWCPIRWRADASVRSHAQEAIHRFADEFEKLNFSKALEQLWELIGKVDAYLTAGAPWKKDLSIPADKQEVAKILYTAAESIRVITALVYPILPESAAKIWKHLGLGDIKQAIANHELENIAWGALKPGTKLGEVAPVFPRAEKDAIDRMQELEQNNIQPSADAQSPDTKTVDAKTAESPAESYGHLAASPEAPHHAPVPEHHTSTSVVGGRCRCTRGIHQFQRAAVAAVERCVAALNSPWHLRPMRPTRRLPLLRSRRSTSTTSPRWSCEWRRLSLRSAFPKGRQAASP